ncbi:MAG TPA: hypothetical protein PK668_21210 [Myxococcota bacterium]|nr:hypothetical protein [Myxococcota bacterium]HRY95995.1 hypothetical protein [Myxococcota bacterium]HSA21791.1 hypothetical protein [Myxococcota bacterium]
MHATRWLWLGLGLLLSAGPARAQADLSGEWAYQALNSGDTNFQVEHKGAQLTLYRVLHPEYEGKPYKLEHIFRGELRGTALAGDLFVREEGMPEFEKLRAWTGQVQAADRMAVDEMPLRRVLKDSAAPPAAEPVAAAPDKLKVVILPKPAPGGTEEAKPADGAVEAAKVALAAPQDIPDLTPVSRAVPTDAERQAGALRDEGDQAYEAGRHELAVEKYAAALERDPHRVELFYKLGLGYALLADRAGKAGQVEPARILYTQAIGAWERAFRLDPYNWGTQENLRRARLRLGKLR